MRGARCGPIAAQLDEARLTHEETARDGQVDIANQLALEGEHLQPYYVKEAATVGGGAATVCEVYM